MASWGVGPSLNRAMHAGLPLVHGSWHDPIGPSGPCNGKNGMAGLMAGLLNPLGPKSWPIVVGGSPWARFGLLLSLVWVSKTGLQNSSNTTKIKLATNIN